MSVQNAMQQRADNQFTALKTVKRDAAALAEASEKLRMALDDVDASLRAACEVGCAISQEDYQRLLDRITKIRHARNGMEAFEMQCRVKEITDKAWEALPQ